MPNKPSLAARKQCTGCGACANVCPAAAILLAADSEGFLYPTIGEGCTDCGACQKACPILAPASFHPAPGEAYAAWCNNDDERSGSSSGGFFRVLVQYVLGQQGMVFGAAFDDDFQVKHQSGESEQDCRKFYGSKYLQSQTGQAYRQAKAALEQGRWVLYSGTPCQVAGLYAYLGGDAERLITCDLVCNGVPSPAVFRQYLSFLERRYQSQAVEVRFKDKSRGWHTPCFSVAFANGTRYVKPVNDTEYGRGFGSRLFLRPSCGCCLYAKAERCADFTLGDFWGLGKETPFTHDTQKGVSMVLYNSEKAAQIQLPPLYQRVPRTFSEAVAGNERLSHSLTHNPRRAAFFDAFASLPFDQVMASQLAMPGLAYRLLAKATPAKLKQVLRRLISGGK